MALMLHAGVVVTRKLRACCCVMRVTMASIWSAWACADVASLVDCCFVPTANQILSRSSNLRCCHTGPTAHTIPPPAWARGPMALALRLVHDCYFTLLYFTLTLPTGSPCSATGALIAVLAACNVSAQHALDLAHDLCQSHGVFRRPLGLAGVWGQLVRAWLQELLPQHAAELCSSRTTVVVTELRGLAVALCTLGDA